MNRRSLAVVAALAVLAIVLAVIGQRGGEPPRGPVGEPVMPALADALAEVRRVTVLGAGDEAVVTLERGDDGWSVAERDAYPADFGMLRDALTALAEAEIIELKTANPALYDRIGVEDLAFAEAGSTGVRVDTGSETLELILGDADRSNTRFARRPGDPASFTMNRNPEVPKDPTQWLQPVIVDVPGTRIRRVSIRHADDETLELSKSDPADTNFSVADVPEGRELQYPGVANTTGNALRELRLEDVRRFDAAAAGEPTVTATWVTFDGLEIEATGFELDDNRWVRFTAETEAAADSDEAAAINARVDGWLYRIPSFQYDQMTRRLTDLLAAPEE